MDNGRDQGREVGNETKGTRRTAESVNRHGGQRRFYLRLTCFCKAVGKSRASKAEHNSLREALTPAEMSSLANLQNKAPRRLDLNFKPKLKIASVNIENTINNKIYNDDDDDDDDNNNHHHLNKYKNHNHHNSKNSTNHNIIMITTVL
jgi:hypothetical protein